jgi:hypothetical protein
MYNRGYEAWTAWRTYDMPGFNLPAVSLLPVPTRLTYPISEQNLNQANYAAASTAIGGDEQTTKFSGIKTKKIVLEYNLLKAAPGSPFCYQYLTEISVLLKIYIHENIITILNNRSIPLHCASFLLRDPIPLLHSKIRITSKYLSFNPYKSDKTTLSFYMCLHPQNILTQ